MTSPAQPTLLELAQLVRYYVLTATTAAESGHPTSCLSAVELMTSLFFGGFLKFDVSDPTNANNDRFILSKGHAAPLLYALYAAAGVVSEAELLSLRQFGSRLEGHPTTRFPLTELATGSLGQGLSVGVGMALNAQRFDHLPYTTFVLLGDGELAEGSNWEAMALAAHYKLNQLVAIADINRLGQTGQTLHGHNLDAYQSKCRAFGWRTIIIDGHNFSQIEQAFQTALSPSQQPTMILAKTIKGKGVSFLEDQDNWHGKSLNKNQLDLACKELGMPDRTVRGRLAVPEKTTKNKTSYGKMREISGENYQQKLSVRQAYGHGLVELADKYPELIVLDAEVSNSTFAGTFKQHHPDRFLEMFIAEQNMVGVGVGLSLRGKIPYISTFGAFMSRAFDQIRMAGYAQTNCNFVGSHVGVSIGQDGVSQMGLEDIALFRSIWNSVVLYPADHVATEQLTYLMAEHEGVSYLRSTRAEVEPIYSPDEKFVIGGSKTLFSSPEDLVTVVAAGITLHEAIAAYHSLQKKGISIRVIDLYSIKPLDEKTVLTAANETKALITVEDHYAAGGIGEAVASLLAQHAASTPLNALAVTKLPQSGQPQQLLAFEEIDRSAIITLVEKITRS
jgi:transketolase